MRKVLDGMLHKSKYKLCGLAAVSLLSCWIWGSGAPTAEANVFSKIKQIWQLPNEFDKMMDDYTNLKEQYDSTLLQLEHNRMQLEHNQKQLEEQRQQLTRSSEEMNEALNQLQETNEMLAEENGQLRDQNRNLADQVTVLQQEAAKKSALTRRWVTMLLTLCSLILGYFLLFRGIRFLLRYK